MLLYCKYKELWESPEVKRHMIYKIFRYVSKECLIKLMTLNNIRSSVIIESKEFTNALIKTSIDKLIPIISKYTNKVKIDIINYIMQNNNIYDIKDEIFIRLCTYIIYPNYTWLLLQSRARIHINNMPDSLYNILHGRYNIDAHIAVLIYNNSLRMAWISAIII